MSPPELVLLSLAAFVGSTAQSATGFGVLLFLAPVSFALQDPTGALLTITIAAIGNNVLVVATRGTRLTVRRIDAVLLIASALPGLALGALVVSHLSKPTMQLAVGGALICAVALRAHQPDRATRLDHKPAGAAIGLLSGVLTTTVGLNGPPLVIWLRARRATLAEMRDTLAVVFLTLNLTAIPALRQVGATTSEATLAAVTLGLVLGHIVGVTCSNRAPTAALERAIGVLFLVAGTVSIGGGMSTTF